MKNYRSYIAALGACIAAGSLAAALASAHDVTASAGASGYQMAAVIDRARGNVVLAGDYAAAIDALGGKDRRHFEASTNLCVAYTMSGDLEKADNECDAAVAQSESAAVLRDRAVALSNRGVVRAVRGDLSGAREDFSRALEIHGDLQQASDNLRLLGAAGASDA